jgi:hypothetical protein
MSDVVGVDISPRRLGVVTPVRRFANEVIQRGVSEELPESAATTRHSPRVYDHVDVDAFLDRTTQRRRSTRH